MDRICPHTTTIIVRRYRKWSIFMLVGAACILGVLAAAMTRPDPGQVQSPRPEKFRALDLDDDDDDDLFQTSGKDPPRCVKRVHLFASDREMRHIPELHSYTELFKSSTHPLGATGIDCHSDGYDCDIILTMGGNVDYLEGKDVVVFGLVATEFRGEGSEQLEKLLKLKPAPGQTWVYFSTEPPLRVLRWTRDLNFSRLKYHLLMTYDLASDIVVPFGVYRPFTTPGVNGSSTDGAVKTHRLPDPLLGKERMIAWIASNCHAFWPRVKFIRKMSDFLPLDDYGKCGRKECLPKRSKKCNELLAQYKFFFAIPNAECNDYITEKFWLESLTHGNVPVVLGSRKESYEKVAPPNSFIHYSDFNSSDDFVKYLTNLNKDDEAYRRFFDWRSQGEVVLTFPTRPSIFCKTLPHLQEKGKETQYKYIGDSPWYKGCRMTPDRKVFDLTKKEEYSIFEKSDINNWTVWR